MNLSFSQSENSGQSDTLKSVGILVPFCILKMLHSRCLLLGQTLLLSFTFGHSKEDVLAPLPSTLFKPQTNEICFSNQIFHTDCPHCYLQVI